MKSLEEKNEEFVLNILHDIKSPIIGINIALQNLSDKNEILDEIYKVNRHNLKYIEDLIENYSFKTGKYEPKYENINLIALINEEIFALRFLIIEKKLKLKLVYGASNMPLTTDKNLLRQAILNLVTNSVKYSPKSSTVKIEISHTKTGVLICFSNEINKKIEKSTGLGKEIIKNAVEKLKGKIYHTKEQNKICIFLEIPN